jgi:DNA-binding protein HU-beta
LINNKTLTKGKNTMNKSELVSAVAKTLNIKLADATKAVDATLGCIVDSLSKGEDVRLVGFGSFGITQRAARTGRNPRTGAPIKIAASKTPSFRAGKEFKQAVA